jgi:hypothetical protein
MPNRRISSLCLVLLAAPLAAACSVEDRNYGAGGAGGSPAQSSAAGVVDCSDPQPEQCFDGLDNDCDGATDCADSACEPGALCVDAPMNFQLGVVVAEGEPCPDGFQAEEALIYRGLTGGDCAGCDCTPNPTDCKAGLWYYTTEAACTGDVNLTGGTYAGEFGPSCNGMPISELFLYGARASAFKVTQTCKATGTAAPAPATWESARKFCRATAAGAGCDAGQACVPKHDPAAQCALTSGSAVCEGYGSAQNDWFTGYSDTRSCSSCACVASGGHCNNVNIWLGNDYTCFEDTWVPESGKWCGQKYAPPAFLAGTPKDPTCSVTAKLDGSLDPTGQSTLCCLQ